MVKKAALGKGIASLLGGSEGLVQKNHPVSQSSKINDKKMPFPPKTIRAGKNVASATPGVFLNNEKKSDISSAGSIGPTEISIEKIKENPYQPRKHFKDEELLELSRSIRTNGVIQPLVVTKKDNHFELIAGERRLRASKLAGLSKVPVVVKQVTDRDRLVMAIIENVQRSDLNCVEEAYAYFKLMDEFNLTQEEVATRVGKERSSIANFLRILKLPRKVIEFLQKELLSLGHAKVLGGIKDAEDLEKFAEEAVSRKLSVRELENLVKFQQLGALKGKKKDAFDEEKDQMRQQLERRTGFHIQVKEKENGSGLLMIKYHNGGDFNKIYDFLMSK